MLLAAALLLPASASALPAPKLFETTGAGNKQVIPPSNLYSIDPATGAATTVGNTGYAITGLAQDPTSGILYAVSNSKSPIAPLTLLKIDPNTGAATAVGPLGGKKIADITFDSQGRLFGWSESTDDLASIDKQSGAVTIVPSALGSAGSGSSFDRDDNFWLFPDEENGGYDTIDLGTGVATNKGTLTPIDAKESEVSAAAWDCARTTLYATLNDEGEPPANLVTIDTTTGAITNKGSTVTGADGLEWFCPLAFEFTGTALKVGPGKEQTLSVSLVRGPRIKGAASVAYSTQNGSALAGRDFKRVSGTATFPNNVTQQPPLALTVTPDPKAGRNRSFTVVLSSPSADGSVGGPLEITITTAKPMLKVIGPKRAPNGHAVFTLRSNQTPAKFRCKLDGGKFKGCGKNGKKGKRFQVPALEPGAHTLVVQAANAAGRRSKTVKKKFEVLG